MILATKADIEAETLARLLRHAIKVADRRNDDFAAERFRRALAAQLAPRKAA